MACAIVLLAKVTYEASSKVYHKIQTKKQLKAAQKEAAFLNGSEEEDVVVAVVEQERERLGLPPAYEHTAQHLKGAAQPTVKRVASGESKCVTHGSVGSRRVIT